MDGLLAQEYGNYPAGSEVMQNLMSPLTVVNQAQDFIERQKQQSLRRQYNEMLLDKAQQMSPLDIMKAKAEAAKAEAMSTPEILQSGQEGYKAQNLLQQIAARRKQATEQSDIEAALAENKATTGKNKLLGQLSSGIDLQYNQGAPESMRTSAALQNNALADSLAKLDPSFIQKSMLQDDRLASALEIQGMRNEAKMKELEEKHQKQIEVKSLEHAYVRDMDAYKANPTPENKARVQSSWDAYRSKLLAQSQGKPNIGSFGIETNTPVPTQAPGTGAQISDSDLIGKYLK